MKLTITLFFGLILFSLNAQNEIEPAEHDSIKIKWIKENPEEYKKMGGDPTPFIEDEIKIVDDSNQNSSKLEPFIALSSYKVTSVNAIPLPGANVTEVETKNMTENVKHDIPIGMILEYGSENKVRLSFEDRIDFRCIETKKENNIEWFSKNNDCESCSKTLYLTIQEESPNQLVYLLKDEDEGANFSYLITFNKQ